VQPFLLKTAKKPSPVHDQYLFFYHWHWEDSFPVQPFLLKTAKKPSPVRDEGFFAIREMAASLGFEPRQTAPEAVVLPLHNEAMELLYFIRTIVALQTAHNIQTRLFFVKRIRLPVLFLKLLVCFKRSIHTLTNTLPHIRKIFLSAITRALKRFTTLQYNQSENNRRDHQNRFLHDPSPLI
jgi:hypothetical protein